MPRAESEAAIADITALALAEVVALPKEIAVAGVVWRINLDERRRGISSVLRVEEYVHDQRVLVDQAPAAVRCDAVKHSVTDRVTILAGHFHHQRWLAGDIRQTKRGRRAKFRSGLRRAARAIEVFQIAARGRREIAAIEIPL